MNGNAIVSLSRDGTRVIKWEGELKLEYPLNIDIRVQSKCALGFNPGTGKAVCDFCHESATVNGKECDYTELQSILSDVPPGIELAIGCNYYSAELESFLRWAKKQGFVVNITVNQLTAPSMKTHIQRFIDEKLIKGLGISYRTNTKPIPFIEYDNMVLHVIAGIDDFYDIKELSKKGVKKILVLGEKDFGFNVGNVDLSSKKHKLWLWHINTLFKLFNVVSFDNLALEQLKIRRFFPDELWDVSYQHEHSFYINAVDKYFSPSSRNPNKSEYQSIKDYFITMSKL